MKDDHFKRYLTKPLQRNKNFKLYKNRELMGMNLVV